MAGGAPSYEVDDRSGTELESTVDREGLDAALQVDGADENGTSTPQDEITESSSAATGAVSSAEDVIAIEPAAPHSPAPAPLDAPATT